LVEALQVAALRARGGDVLRLRLREFLEERNISVIDVM
jgi:hypothetical protein